MALSWCLPGQASALSLAIYKRVQTGGALVPIVWHLEVANILGLKLRSGNLSQPEMENAISVLSLLNIQTAEETRKVIFTDLLPLMKSVSLTAYDVTYIGLALQNNLPLATFDKEMIEVARQSKVVLLTS